jgi:hypothetical protein
MQFRNLMCIILKKTAILTLQFNVYLKTFILGINHKISFSLVIFLWVTNKILVSFKQIQYEDR